MRAGATTGRFDGAPQVVGERADPVAAAPYAVERVERSVAVRGDVLDRIEAQHDVTAVADDRDRSTRGGRIIEQAGDGPPHRVVGAVNHEVQSLRAPTGPQPEVTRGG